MVRLSNYTFEIRNDMLRVFPIPRIQDATGETGSSQQYSLSGNRCIYLVVSKGNVIINDIVAGNRDGVYINNEKQLEFIFQGDAEMIFLDLPNLTT